jgi:aryl-alcohol dehydrogenase-like predicted oxidoreductase
MLRRPTERVPQIGFDCCSRATSCHVEPPAGAVTRPGRVPTADFGGTVVSRLGFGGMSLAGPPRGPALTSRYAGKLLHEAVDRGITFIDTSIDYGRSESLVGQHLHDRRDEIFLATKCGCVAGIGPEANPSPYPHEYTRANIRNGVMQSLQRLRTSHIDLLQLHHPVPPDELLASQVLDELEALRAEHVFTRLGVSADPAALPGFIGLGVFDAVQMQLTAHRDRDRAVLRLARERGLGTIVRGVFRLRRGPAGQGADTSLAAAVGLREVDVVLVGTTSLDHLSENVAVSCMAEHRRGAAHNCGRRSA